MFGAVLTGGGLATPLVWKRLQNHTSCFASLGVDMTGAIENNHGDPEQCLGHVLILAGSDKRDIAGTEATRLFLTSKGVAHLTNNGIVSVEPPADQWFGQGSIDAKLGQWSDHGRTGNLLHVVFRANVNADALITALRIATQHWKLNNRNSYANYTPKELEVLPLVAALRGGDGLCYSDGYIVFTPITATMAKEYLAVHDHDDLDDAYFDRLTEWCANRYLRNWNSVEMAVKMMKGEHHRPDRKINQKMYQGYIKDEAICEIDRLNDDDVLSITSPWSLEPEPNDTAISGSSLINRVRAVVAQLEN